MAQEYDEKRSFTRLQIESPVSFTVKGQEGKTYQGVSRDLSASGLLMLTEVSLTTGTELTLEMATENSRLPPLEAEGRVVRVEAGDDTDNRYLVSVKLSDIN
jgi:c-di-GMP-binding flagellar brake protein YcgR